MIRTVLPALAIAGLVAAGPAAAQSTRAVALAQLHAEFARADIDHDGVLTKAEVAAGLSHRKLAGTDRRLTPDQARQLTNLWFPRIDLDHDGRVTLAEAESTMGTMFDRYDTNHDGVISPAERAAARAALKAPAKR